MTKADVTEAYYALMSGVHRHAPVRYAEVFMSPEACDRFMEDRYGYAGIMGVPSVKADLRLRGLEMRLQVTL